MNSQSRTNNSRSNNTKVQDKSKKSYCKVCADAKKPIEEVTNHNVKSPEGVVLCPTLLSQSCRYCKQNGHTVKFCKSLEEKSKMENKIQSQINFEKVQQAKMTAKNQPNSKKYASKGFSALCQDTDSESESDSEDIQCQQQQQQKQQKQQKQEYPSLPGIKCQQSLSSQQAPTISYATALQTAPKPVAAVAERQIPKIPIKANGKVSKWVLAEYEDSSDEEDEDDSKLPVLVAASGDGAW